MRGARAGPGTHRKPPHLPPPGFPPQPLLTAQSFVQCQGLQLIHDAGAYLHHAVPVPQQLPQIPVLPAWYPNLRKVILQHRSEEHTSELQSRLHLVCRLLLEKKKKNTCTTRTPTMCEHTREYSMHI